HTDDPQVDFVELYNASNASVDISGCAITDSISTNKYLIPPGTILASRAFVSFNQNDLGFSLSAAGETIYLISADNSRILDAIHFEGQENGVSSGRSPDGAPDIRRLATPTPGAKNSGLKTEQVVINELMYDPISGNDDDQYVELYNTSNQAIDLSQWSFVKGIDFTFPAGAKIAPFGYVVVAKNAARLKGAYSQLNTNNTFGDFSGKLSGSGEEVSLAKFDATVSTNEFGIEVTNKIHIPVSTVAYRPGGRWPELPDGGGSSLELIDPRADTLRASNWQASDETSKSQWGTFEYTGKLDFGDGGTTANRLQITMLGAGECLVDAVEVLNPNGPNLLNNGGFESGTSGWNFFGHHQGSSVETSGAIEGQRVLHVRAPGDGDTGNNSIRGNLSRTLASGETITIRAKVRWLQGWPEVLFRIRGGWLEMPVRMNVPANLGTPGLPNSRLKFNAGPAIYDVAHSPILPQASETVKVTARITDPDGVATPRVKWRVDGSATTGTTNMRDDGLSGDELAGDGIYTATLTGRGAGTIVAFTVEASDDASPGVTNLFPNDSPARECLIRWGDPVPFGNFLHYHMWDTAATENAFNNVSGLDNRYWDTTLVYGNNRVIYNAGFRNKGSPYHGGRGDIAVTVPKEDLLLGIDDRVFGSTGNGGNEGTAMKGDISGWIGEKLGIPFLHSHYMRLFRNGSQHRGGEGGGIIYDLEQPNRSMAKSWFGGGGVQDDLYKIAVWFEFGDDNGGFSATGASLERFVSGGAYKLARYRYNWQIRPDSPTASDYSSIFNLIAAANSSSERITKLPSLANMEEWMRVFAFHRVLGNWDSYGYSVGQNMYLYTPLGQRAVLMPWDVDFVLGDGDGPGAPLYGGQDPVLNTLFDQPIYRRALYRAFQDAINGPMQSANYQPQIDARKAALDSNGVTGTASPAGIGSYLESRRALLQNQIQSQDVSNLSITCNGGADFTSNSATTPLTGSAPFAVATIEINGVPYPVTWTGLTTWTVNVPLGGATNVLQVVGKDLRGNPVPGATDTITVKYTGPVPRAEDWIVINEIMYHSLAPNADYVELYNRHSSYSFDLSGLQMSGIDYQFPPGTFIPANGYVAIAENTAAFGAAYGASIPVLGPFAGNLQNGGEMLRLVRPGATPAEEVVIDDVRYSDIAPWPSAADGLGPSLQLIDPAQDNWRAGNWAATAPNDSNMATPGRANITRSFIDAFPNLWINEVLPQNLTGASDNLNQHEPWIELYNSGSTTIDLSAAYLSDDSANLLKWQFPAG
ncbi:MAG: lamin tail domain-containing protein, partial [Verrucomicrobiota bacterium]